MKDPYIKRYLYLMLAIFGAISLSIVVFFAVYRFRGIGDGLHTGEKIRVGAERGGVLPHIGGNHLPGAGHQRFKIAAFKVRNLSCCCDTCSC